MANTDLILDTGGWLFALAGVPEYAEALEDASRAIVPALVLAEVDYHLRARRREMWRLLERMGTDGYVLEPLGSADLVRARQIDQKFSSVKLGLVDASVVALAERVGVDRVLTSDSDLAVVRYGPRWNRALRLVVPPARSRRR